MGVPDSELFSWAAISGCYYLLYVRLGHCLFRQSYFNCLFFACDLSKVASHLCRSLCHLIRLISVLSSLSSFINGMTPILFYCLHVVSRCYYLFTHSILIIFALKLSLLLILKKNDSTDWLLLFNKLPFTLHVFIKAESLSPRLILSSLWVILASYILFFWRPASFHFYWIIFY